MESFRPLTRDGLARVRVRAKEAAAARRLAAAQRKAAAAAAAAAANNASTAAASNSVLDASLSSLVGPMPAKAAAPEEVAVPNRKLVAGLKLPPNLSNYFSVKRLAGRPLEDIDSFYEDKETFVVVARDKTIFRFSASNAFFVLGPLNPIRRAAIYILTHPLFSFVVLLAIIINCVFMAMSAEQNITDTMEYTFTAIYTCEALIKALARGMILSDFTYLRDAWNWLDFIVIGLAYLMFCVSWLGRLSALRSLRVLRALKTVTAVPGLKTIVGALMEAVKRLRDVLVLTIFVLSIFALIGLQLFRGTLLRKCVLPFNGSMYDGYENGTELAKSAHYNNEENWRNPITFCKGNDKDNDTEASGCPPGYICYQTDVGNPNFNYTNFDSFPTALLCSFRLMTQDYWENLYQLVIRTNGLIAVVYFVIIILFGSFYLLNVILAIVAISYDEVQKKDIADEEEEEQAKKEEEERREQMMGSIMRKSSSELSDLSLIELYHLTEAANRGDERVERISVKSADWRGGVRTCSFSINRFKEQESHSVPASPIHRPRRDLAKCPDQPPPAYEEAATLEAYNIPYFDDTPRTPRSERSPAGSQTKVQGRTSPRPTKRRSLLPSSTKTALLQYIAYEQQPTAERLSQARRQLLNFGQFRPSLTSGPDLPTKRRSIDAKPGGSSGDMQAEQKDVVVLQTLVDDATNGGQHTVTYNGYLDEERKPSRLLILKQKFLKMFCSWTCCPCWFKFQNYVSIFILDAFVELFITICILVNTLFMAIDNPTATPELKTFLKNANYFFTVTFAIEAFMKTIALSPPIYFRDGWNIFDFFIVILSLIELPLSDFSGLSILRSFRLLRVFKLAKSWKTMNLLFAIIGRTVGALGNLIVVLAIIIFIFAVVGMQLFGENYNDFKNETRYPEYRGDLPRWHMVDFTHAFMVIFRVLCGEWIESMWDCMRVNDWKCIPFFLLTMTIANLVVLNLFLALLINSFGAESLQRREEEEEVNKLQEAIDRIYRFVTWIKIHLKQLAAFLLTYFRLRRSRYPPDLEAAAGELPGAGGAEGEAEEEKENCLVVENGIRRRSTSEQDSPATIKSLRKVDPSGTTVDDHSPVFDEDPEVNEVDVVYWDAPEECFPRCFTDRCPRSYACCVRSRIGQLWWDLRCKAYFLVEHKYFETFIIFMIVVSSLTLTLEDRKLDERKTLKLILEYLDKCFTIIFTFEMLIKWFAFGLRKYFKDAWCWLDFIIVTIALLSLALSYSGGGDTNIGAFKAMRTLRALRPLRAVSRWEGMKVVVNALIQAIPSIFNVLLVCLVFWLIFSIIGMQMFGGKFWRCVTNDSDAILLDSELIPNKTACLEYARLHNNVTWKNARINFDTWLNGYLALFQVATYKGWIEVMNDAVDSTKIDEQPIYENSTSNYLFFVLFIIFGAFFTLKLFIGVIIDNFNVQKKKAGGSLELFMTEDQKKYYKAMKKISNTAPQKPIPKPKVKFNLFFYRMVTNQKFDIIILVVIMLNTVVMCMEGHKQSEEFKSVLDIINKVFIVIFTGEFVVKILGLRWHYFKVLWNNFDFIIVVFSFVCWAVEAVMEAIGISPTLIRIVRVFRIGRVLRLVKSARGIRTLLFSLFVSLPALFNIALLLFLIMFIYAIVGMSFFSQVKHYGGIDETFNFETFPNAMIILFQISTSAGWHSILDGLMNEERPFCEPEKKNCGSYLVAVIYLCSYLVISFLVIVNMYIAIILENFSQATEDEQQGLTQDDYVIFYEKWENYDLKAKGFIKLEDCYEFLNELEPPLGIAKPNRIKLATLAVPICKGDTIYCVDLLDALTRNFLGTSTDEEELANLKPKKKGKADERIVVSNTLQRQREIYAARVVTKVMRRVVELKRASRSARTKEKQEEVKELHSSSEVVV